MIPRAAALSRPAASAARRTAAAAATTPARHFSANAAASQLNKSNVVLELDAKKVGTEIRKRGLANVVSSSTRDGGMDRVSEDS
jgi:N-acetyl-gamma-glutamyl-phosphate reductase/acetylglutamate kinase